MPADLAWCLLDLPAGVELTQSETAASIGISERQLRRIEHSLLEALAELRAMRALRDEFLSSGDPGDVRSPGADVQNENHASHAAKSSPVSDAGVIAGVGRRAGLPRRFRRSSHDQT